MAEAEYEAKGERLHIAKGIKLGITDTTGRTNIIIYHHKPVVDRERERLDLGQKEKAEMIQLRATKEKHWLKKINPWST